jgi:hypothetical protein
MWMAASTAPKWTIKGQVVIACNCDYGCPCNVNGRPTTGKCEGGWTWSIEKGVFGDTPLDGLAIGQYANWPAAIHEGNGVAVSFIDDRANAEQREALATLLDGHAGGPWAIFRPTYRELHGPRFVRYAVDAETRLPRVVADGAVELEMRYILNPVTGETIHPSLVLPEGLIVKEAYLTATSRFNVNDDHVKYDHSGRYGASGFFQYFGP